MRISCSKLFTDTITDENNSQAEFEIFDDENLIHTLASDRDLQTGRISLLEFAPLSEAEEDDEDLDDVEEYFNPTLGAYIDYIRTHFGDKEAFLSLVQAKAVICQMGQFIQLIHPGGNGVFALVATKDNDCAVAFFIRSPREDGSIQIQLSSVQGSKGCIWEQCNFLVADNFL